MNIPATRSAPHPRLEITPGLIEALRERRDRGDRLAAGRLATHARHKTLKQGVKAAWANVSNGGRTLRQGEPYRLVGLIQPAHEISDEDFDRQVSDILDIRDRATRTA